MSILISLELAICLSFLLSGHKESKYFKWSFMSLFPYLLSPRDFRCFYSTSALTTTTTTATELRHSQKMTKQIKGKGHVHSPSNWWNRKEINYIQMSGKLQISLYFH